MHNGNRIKIFRELKNYTQEYVSEKLGMSQQAYSYLEQNGIKDSDDRLDIISNILGVTKETILKFETDKIFNQTNNDNSSGNMSGIFYQQNTEIISLIIEQKNLMEKLIELIDKKIK